MATRPRVRAPVRASEPVRAKRKRASTPKTRPPTPIPSPQGGGEECAAAPARKTTSLRASKGDPGLSSFEARAPGGALAPQDDGESRGGVATGEARPARKPRNPMPLSAIESRRVRMTPALYANVRHRYEHTTEGLASMGADLGCSAETVRNIARREGWVRHVAPPRDLSPAARLAARIEAMRAANPNPDPTPIPSPQGGGEENDAALRTPLGRADDDGVPPTPDPSPQGGGEENAAAAQTPFVPAQAGTQSLTAGQAAPGSPLSRGRADDDGSPRARGRADDDESPRARGRADDDMPPSATADALPSLGATVEEMHRVLLAELATVKAMRARMRAAPQTPADAEKTARTLHNLMTILREIRLQQAGAAAATAAEAETKEKDIHDIDDDHDRDDPYDDLPADIDAFRLEFARRIRAFVERRIAARRDAGGDAAPPAGAGGA